ncbi:MAG: DUF937 domain-containing protein [Xanthobacteraceae bacterium]|nr:DUF937 domain-containing protein [Xanthobacteraceae bacterium]MBX3534103.1 DUF937 domain-containing protein [Xanthobacteraceae bacterium]MBX3548838.1 DUF937 domain-containing protein [Xanthobacteraceae bacterium]MCW5674469.1 DUF937 domain-containing protein [Xanthobacteraceae bacterium]MCW5678786.1 DUF937 domain-containing protein [Xanthobacteraceae bacterium]
MSLLEGVLGEVLKGVLNGNVNQQQQSQLPDIFGQILKNTDFGSIGGLLKQLQQGGLEQQVNSWLGDGKNLPVTPGEIKGALGNEKVKQIAQQLGIPVDEALKKLTQFFPEAVNQASPDGQLAAQHEAQGRSGR